MDRIRSINTLFKHASIVLIADLGPFGARLQFDAACMFTKECTQSQSNHYTIVRGVFVRAVGGRNGAAGLGLIRAAAGSKPAGFYRGRGSA